MPDELDRIKAAYSGRDEEEQGDADQRRLSWLIPENHLLDFHLQRFLLTGLTSAGWNAKNVHECRLLDIGCGRGRVLGWYHAAGIRSIEAIELIQNRAQQAAELQPFAKIRQASMDQLPYADKTFDVVSQVLSFSSCLDEELKRRASKEMLRVLKPGGRILWADLRPGKGMRNYLKGINVKDLRSYFPDCEIESRIMGPIPWYLGVWTSLVNQGIVRSLAKAFKVPNKMQKKPIKRSPALLSCLLNALPWTSCYVAAVIRKKEGANG